MSVPFTPSMRRLRSVLVCALAMVTPWAARATEPAAEATLHRLLLVTDGADAAADLARVLAPFSGQVRRLGASNLHIVDLPPQASGTAWLARLSRHPGVRHVERDRVARAAMVVNDPYAGSEWHLDRVKAPSAWNTAQGQGVAIAILDSGVAPHPDLAPNLLPGWNFVDGNADTSDVQGHGTAVAGVAAARMNNGLGVAGVAGMARILPVRIAWKTATGDVYTSWSNAAAGIVWAADHGARVANLSYVDMLESATVQWAAQYMRSRNGLVVTSAGNDRVNLDTIVPTPPVEALVTVSATDHNNAKASFSSYGKAIVLAAPGVDIGTTATGGQYQYWNGTSVASPIVAAAAALVMSAKPQLSSDQVRQLLTSTATDLGATGRDAWFGYGLVNAQLAVTLTAWTAPDVTPPTVSIAAPFNGSTVSGVVPVVVSASDNVGVTRYDLTVNGKPVTTSLQGFSSLAWDARSVANGYASLAVTAWDANGNTATATTLVKVAN